MNKLLESGSGHISSFIRDLKASRTLQRFQRISCTKSEICRLLRNGTEQNQRNQNNKFMEDKIERITKLEDCTSE